MPIKWVKPLKLLAVLYLSKIEKSPATSVVQENVASLLDG